MTLKKSLGLSLTGLSIGLAVGLVLCPFVGVAADRWGRRPVTLYSTIACLALVSAEPAAGQLTLSLDLFAQGLTRPTDLANAGDTRLFATEQAGVIRIIA